MFPTVLNGCALSIIRIAMLCFVLAFQMDTAAAQEAPFKQSGTLGIGTTWATPWHVIDSGNDGPTVLITGGVHGNEPAGYRAAEQILHWPVTRGKLIVMPQINRLGLAANIRWSPDHRNDRKRRDINRSFPTSERDDPLTEQTVAIWEFIRKHDPDWVFDLHEGFDFHRENPKSVGSSVIAFPHQAEMAKRILKSVNAHVEPSRHFDLLAKNGPVNGSLARACHEQLGAESFIFETTFKDQHLSHRMRQHRRMVSTALLEIGTISEDCVDRLTSPTGLSVTNVALFDDSGANASPVLAVIDNRPELNVTIIGRHDIHPETLNQFDVIVFPGGSGSKQGHAIGDVNREHIRQFVRDGGGIVGICAGAYLCSSHYTWSLHLMNASVFNKSFDIPGKGRKSMWYRGAATHVDVELTDRGADVLGINGTKSIRYQNGPILSPGDKSDLPTYEPWAYFRTENGIYKQQVGTMVGAPAVVFAKYGEGRVLAISPHFESTPGEEDVVTKAILYVQKNREQRAVQ